MGKKKAKLNEKPVEEIIKSDVNDFIENKAKQHSLSTSDVAKMTLRGAKHYSSRTSGNKEDRASAETLNIKLLAILLLFILAVIVAAFIIANSMKKQ